MSRRSYYVFLSFFLCLIPLLFLFNNFAIVFINNSVIYLLRNCLIFFVIIYELSQAERVWRTAGFVSFTVFLAGMVFVEMHWTIPLILVPVFSISTVALLYFNNFKRIPKEKHVSLVLSLILIHLFGFLFSLLRYPGVGLIGLLEFVLMFTVGVILAAHIFKQKRIG